MPRSRRSLAITDSYRDRLLASRTALQARARQLWPTIEALDETRWPELAAAAVSQAQIDAIRLSGAYLSAYLSAELGRRRSVAPIDASPYVGKSRDGRPLTESLHSPIIGTLGYLKEGLSASESLARGLVRAVRMVGVDFDHAHHTALLSAIDADERFDGWRRSLAGTCGACASVASGISHALQFPVHPGCQCVASPVVGGVADTFPVPTGIEVFERKDQAEQDEMVGPKAAGALRSGLISMSDLHGISHMDEGPNFITQRPVAATTT